MNEASLWPADGATGDDWEGPATRETEVEAENFESIHNHSAYAVVRSD